MPSAVPTAHVSLDALRHNLALVRQRVGADTGVLAAVKANGYGHGAVPVARHLETCGVTWFGVATADEALELRRGGIEGGILIFSPVYERLGELVEADVALSVVDELSLSAVAGLRGARVHLKVDTGMGRLGLKGADAAALAAQVDRTEGVTLEGLWTHFAASDEAESHMTEMQLGAFTELLARLERGGLRPPLVHSANSAAVFAYPEAQFDMVRPGIALYGYHSSPHIAGLEPGLTPAMTLKAPITFVKRVAAGTPISYSALWHAPQDTTVATVRIGYADGYPRRLTGQGEVAVQGQLRPIAGRVCMDQLMVDVGELSPEPGEQVTLFGPDLLDAETLAARIGTISYELLVSVGARVARVYA